MKVRIFERNSNWTMIGELIKETDEKIFVWSNERQTIEMHFPKHTHYYIREDAHK